MEKTIINFTETNVDGCGSDANAILEVYGPNKVTKDIITEIKSQIHHFISNNKIWDTDLVIAEGCKVLSEYGYTYKIISYDYEIIF